MLDNGVITIRQLVLLMITIRGAQTLVIIHSVAMGLKQDAWLGELLAIPIQMLMFFIIYKLYKRYPRSSIVSYCQDILGKPLGRAIGMLFCLYYVLVCTFLIRELAGVLILGVMTETPELVLMAILALATGYVISKGLEVLARVNELVVGILVGAFFVFTAIGLKDVDFGNLLPVLEAQPLAIAKASFASASGFIFVVIIGQILPKVQMVKKGWLYVVLGQLFYGAIIVIATIAIICVLGPGLGETYVQPGYIFTKTINIADIVVRMDSLILTLFITGSFIKISSFYYASVIGLSECLRLKNYKILILPMGLLFVVLGNILFQDYLQYRQVYLSTWVRFNLVFELGLPALLLLVAWLGGKEDKQSVSDAQVAKGISPALARQ